MECVVPPDLIIDILCYLNAGDLFSTLRVSKKWNLYSNQDRVWECLFKRKFSSIYSERPKKSWKWFYHYVLKTNFAIIYTNYYSNSSRTLLINGVCSDINEQIHQPISIIDATQAYSHEPEKRNKTPTLQELEKYAAVVCYSHNSYYEAAFALGDVLADYVDQKGGVVIMPYTCCGCSLSGRWRTGQYDPIIPQQSKNATGIRLGKVYEPDHPIMKGINTFSSEKHNFMLYSPGKPAKEAKIIATMVNDKQEEIPLVVELSVPGRGRVVTLNFLPCSAALCDSGWSPSTDGGKLVVNALRYVAAERM